MFSLSREHKLKCELYPVSTVDIDVQKKEDASLSGLEDSWRERLICTFPLMAAVEAPAGINRRLPQLLKTTTGWERLSYSAYNYPSMFRV